MCIAEIETDKATMEVEAVDEGMLAQDPGARGHRGRGGQHADRADCWAKARARRAPPSRHRASPPLQHRRPMPQPRRSGAPPRRRRRALAAAPKAALPAEPECDRHRPSRMTVREALRDAMAEEMRRDAKRVPDGRGGRASIRAPTRSARACWRNSAPRRVIDTPITEQGFAGLGVGAAFAGLQADRRVHDLQLRHAGDRPDHQLGRQDAATCRAARWAARSCSAAPTAPPRASPPSIRNAMPAGMRHVPGLKVVAPYTRGRRQGPAEGGDPRSQPGDLPRERDRLRPAASRCRTDPDFIVPIGKARDRARRASTSPSPPSRCMVGHALQGGREAGRARASRPR